NSPIRFGQRVARRRVAAASREKKRQERKQSDLHAPLCSCRFFSRELSAGLAGRRATLSRDSALRALRALRSPSWSHSQRDVSPLSACHSAVPDQSSGGLSAVVGHDRLRPCPPLPLPIPF